MSLQNYMTSLTRDQLVSLHGDLLITGISVSMNGDYRSNLATRRASSSGKLKKIYAALYKADRGDINNMIAALVELLPNGTNTNKMLLKTVESL